MNASVCHAFWTYCPVPDIVVQKTRMATMSHGHVHIGDGYKHGGYGRDDRGYGFRGPRYECGSRQVTVVWTCPACGCGGRGKGLQTWSSWKLGYGNSCREGYGDDGNGGFVMMPVLQVGTILFRFLAYLTLAF